MTGATELTETLQGDPPGIVLSSDGLGVVDDDEIRHLSAMVQRLDQKLGEYEDEITILRDLLRECKSGIVQAMNACNPQATERAQQRYFAAIPRLLARIDAALECSPATPNRQ